MAKFIRLHGASSKWLIIMWFLAVLSVIGIYFDIGPNKESAGGGGFVWILPAIIFSFIGLIISIMHFIRR